jgi:quercetin dioxygenase-like cupin family protein/DNA-binding Xre family transcriptional regulator
MAIRNSEIAERLKGIRLLSEVSVTEMASKINITEAEYLAMEQGDAHIPVSILLDACSILGISMTELLTGEPAKLHTYSFVKKGRGLSVERSKAYKYENLAFTFANRKVEPLMVTVEPNDSSEIPVNSHQGQEFHYCIEGTFLLKINNYEVIVEEGDSVYFDSNHPHGMKALNGKCAKILVVTI